MIHRRGFMGGLAALLFGGRASAERLINPEKASSERGVWRDASDPEARATVLIVEGYLLGNCCAINEEAQMVEVDLAEPKPGEHPVLVLCDSRYAKQRLSLGKSLEIYRDGKGHPNRGFRYWTGHGWINSKSEPIPGPFPGVVGELLSGEAIPTDAAVYIRNGRAYRA